MFVLHHTASVLKEILYFINGSNYQFWFLALSLRILYEPQIGNTQKVCLMMFQSIFLYNKLLRVWKIVNCKVTPLLINVQNMVVFLNLNEKMEMKLHIFPRLPQTKASPLI